MSKSFKLYPTHFSRGAKIFSGSRSPSYVSVVQHSWLNTMTSQNHCSEGPRA